MAFLGWAALGSGSSAINDNGETGTDIAQSTMSGPRLFPSEGKTQFGEWIKAGALKQGDRVSTAKSIAAKSATPDGAASEAANDNRIDEAGVTPTAANDNAPLVVSNILLNDHLARVYNFEVESRPGEITHNYLVGNDGAWVHNGRGAAWKKIFNDPNTPRSAKGWIQHQLNRGKTFSRLRNPPGCDLGHHPSKPAKDGYGHGPDDRLEWSRDNRSRGGRFGR